MSEEAKVQKPSLLGMITSPTEQFKRIKERPIIWGAMAIIIILYIIGTWLIAQGIATPELEGFEFEDDSSGGMQVFVIVGIIIGGIFLPLVGTLLASVVYLLVAKIAQSNVSFRQLFSMNTYIMIIATLGLIFNGIIVLLLGGNAEKLPTSLGSIIDTQGAISGLYNSLEVFSIWGVIITAIGLQKVADFSKGLAWTIAIVFFGIGVIFSMIGGAFSGMIGV